DYRSTQSDSATAVAVCPSTVSQACGPCRCGCASTHPETCMSDLLLNHPEGREPLQASFSDAANPLGLDGIEFIEYATSQPQALGQVLEMLGFRPVARHRSREVLLYRQGALNIVVNAHPMDAKGAGHGSNVPTLSAMALRVRD